MPYFYCIQCKKLNRPWDTWDPPWSYPRAILTPPPAGPRHAIFREKSTLFDTDLFSQMIFIRPYPYPNSIKNVGEGSIGRYDKHALTGGGSLNVSEFTVVLRVRKNNIRSKLSDSWKIDKLSLVTNFLPPICACSRSRFFSVLNWEQCMNCTEFSTVNIWGAPLIIN